MRRKIAILLCLSIFAFSGCSAGHNKDAAEYCDTMNRLLADRDYSHAEVGDKVIVLYNADGAMIAEVPFAQYDASIRILSIRKENDIVYFVTQGAVDDENGYMFLNGEQNKVLDGIWYMERVSGNGYAYGTAKP